MRLRWAISVVILAINSVIFLQAGTLYNEAVQGDLSNSGLTPTPIAITVGSNQIFGTTGRDANGIDRDYLTITVPTGLQLTAITELTGTSVGGVVSFIGIQAGSQVTISPNAADAAGLLGWTHYGGAATDTNLLPTMSIPTQGSSGFTPPLSAGDYSIWIQDFNTGSFSYAFDLVLAPAASTAPEPQSYAMMLAGVPVLIFLYQWRRRSLTNLLQGSNNSSSHNA
jgi:hypothetical protein